MTPPPRSEPAAGGEEAAYAPVRRFSLGKTFASLRHRDYRLWFQGQMVSLFGSWMQSTAQGFLVFELTRSTAYLGYVGFAGGVPSWVLTLAGGVAADRLSRRALLLGTQVFMMILALILAGLTLAGMVRPWHILLLAAALGAANAFDAPSRLAFIVEMVDREDLTNAIALNSTMFNLATTLGPAAAGFVYALVGPGWCFAANALSFVGVIAALAMMRLRPRPSEAVAASPWADLGQGLRYVAATPTIYVLIITLGMTSLLGLGLMTLMPAWAVQVLHGDATTNGLLFFARGLGSLAGALVIASLGHMPYKGRLLTAGTVAMPLLMFIFSVLGSHLLSLVSLACVGLALLVTMNMLNSLVQVQVPDGLRGRVMSIYTLVLFGCMPLGALLAGSLADHVGAPAAVQLNAAGLLGFALMMRALFPVVWRLE